MITRTQLAKSFVRNAVALNEAEIEAEKKLEKADDLMSKLLEDDEVQEVLKSKMKELDII